MNVGQSHRRSLIVQGAADCRCILFVTKTIVNQLIFVLYGGKQFIQLQQLNTDLILILTFAIDYLHFVF